MPSITWFSQRNKRQQGFPAAGSLRAQNNWKQWWTNPQKLHCPCHTMLPFSLHSSGAWFQWRWWFWLLHSAGARAELRLGSSHLICWCFSYSCFHFTVFSSKWLFLKPCPNSVCRISELCLRGARKNRRQQRSNRSLQCWSQELTVLPQQATFPKHKGNKMAHFLLPKITSPEMMWEV